MRQEKDQTRPAKAAWEPMRLTPVGDLGTVMQAHPGSRNDGPNTGMMI